MVNYTIKEPQANYEAPLGLCRSGLALFTQVSALLGRIPSAVGYQPTLATDLASLQETYKALT